MLRALLTVLQAAEQGEQNIALFGKDDKSS
jgi:hypothetical protein